MRFTMLVPISRDTQANDATVMFESCLLVHRGRWVDIMLLKDTLCCCLGNIYERVRSPTLYAPTSSEASYEWLCLSLREAWALPPALGALGASPPSTWHAFVFQSLAFRTLPGLPSGTALRIHPCFLRQIVGTTHTVGRSVQPDICMHPTCAR